MNFFDTLSSDFGHLLADLKCLELDWFKYCKPALTTKQVFDRDPQIKTKLQILFTINERPNITFQQFIEYMSQQSPNMRATDYK